MGSHRTLNFSGERSDWETEKSALLDLKQALSAELGELNAKQQTEEEAVGAAKQREELNARKEEALQATRSLHQGLDQAVTKLEQAFSLLPTPVAERLAPYRKLTPAKGCRSYRSVSEWTPLVSLLQAIQIPPICKP